jgi:Ca-activated chloride channel family protein
MIFAHSIMLFLLVIPAILVVWELTRKGHLLALPFDYGVQPKGNVVRWLVLSANLLPALLIAVGILILARPQRQGRPKKKRILTNIEFCLDVSGSMTAAFGEGDRYDAAMNAIRQFTTERKGDAFSLTIFGNEVMRWVPLTKDLSAIANATPFLKPDNLPHQFGGTEIGKAVSFCRKHIIEQEEGDRMIILLSDGQSADLGGSRPRILGEQLKEDRVVLFAIHIGDYVPEELYELVGPTSGKVFAVHDKAGLKQVFQHIDTMKPARLKSRAPNRIDNYHPFVIAGSVLLCAWILTLFGIRFTPW